MRKKKISETEKLRRFRQSEYEKFGILVSGDHETYLVAKPRKIKGRLICQR